MKIQICGYSGSGKSTFAKKLKEIYKIEILHLDTVHFSEGWVERSNEEMEIDVRKFMNQEDWIIDGNYTKVVPERFDECDQLFYFNFNRFTCLINAVKRYVKYRHKTREDIADGCIEKLDFEFIKWILYEGRKRRQHLWKKRIKEVYQEKAIFFKNQKQVNEYLKKIIAGGKANDCSNCI